ncbi:MAG: hypothetical protein ABEJ98_01135 [Candidatus Nanohaloarchaea archaeon]
MEDAPVLHDSERGKGWNAESKKILEEEFDLTSMDVEGIERVLGTGLENSADKIRRAEIDDQPANRVFREAGITDPGKEPVVLAYSEGMTAGELASLLMHGKMLKLQQEMGGVLPNDDGFERKTYKQFALQLPREKIDGIDISGQEKAQFANAWRDYQDMEEAFEKEIEESLPSYPGRRRLLTKREVASEKPVKPGLKQNYISALNRYQEQREKTLSKIAAKRFNELYPGAPISDFMLPGVIKYGETMQFINDVEEAKFEKR